MTLNWRAVPLRRLRVPLASLFAVAGLAASAMTVGGGLVARADRLAERIPEGAHLYLVVRAGEASSARDALAAEGDVRILAERGAGEILAEAGVSDVGPEHLVVLDLRVALGGDGVRAVTERLRAVPGTIDVIDLNRRERRELTPTLVARQLVGGLTLLAFGCGVFLASVVATALFVGREHREELGVRMLLGADAGGLWGPLGIEIGLAAVGGTVAGFLCTFLVARAMSSGALASASPPGWSALLGGLSLLCGTLGLALGAARRAVARAVRAMVLAAWATLLLVGPAFGSTGSRDVAREGDVLRALSRDLAVCRHALHVARKGVARTEHQAILAAAAADQVRLRIAAAERTLEMAGLRRWKERCGSLAAERDRLREALRSIRLFGPEIAPRQSPVQGPVAVRYGQAGRRRGTTGFRNGVALRTRAGEAVRATAPGRVAYSGKVPGSGTVVVIDHGRRTYSVYAKIGRSLVSIGETVDAGQTVARARTGLLYFSIRRRGHAVDPLAWVAEAPKG